MLLSDFYKKKKFTVVTWILVILCLLVSCVTFAIPLIFYRVALWSTDLEPWQYITFIFASDMAPREAMPFHLLMNLFGLIPFGILVEKLFGSVKTFLLFLVEWLITLGAFLLLPTGEYTYIVGISSVVYVFATISFACFLSVAKVAKKDVWKQPLVIFFLAVFLCMIMTLLPVMNGWISTAVNMSGIVVGGIAAWFGRNRIHKRILECSDTLSFCENQTA